MQRIQSRTTEESRNAERHNWKQKAHIVGGILVAALTLHLAANIVTLAEDFVPDQKATNEQLITTSLEQREAGIGMALDLVGLTSIGGPLCLSLEAEHRRRSLADFH